MLCSFIFSSFLTVFGSLSNCIISVVFLSIQLDNYWIDVLLCLWVPKLANVDLVTFKTPM